MTGSPRKRIMLERLEALTRDTFPDDASASHLDFVEHWQASGGMINTLAEALSDAPPIDPTNPDPLRRIVSGEMVMNYLRSHFGGDQVRERLSRAREEGAHRLADEAISIADGADPEDVNVARLRVTARQWTAEKWNPREFGKQHNVSGVISHTHLHLAALQHPTASVAVANPIAVIQPPPLQITAPDTTQGYGVATLSTNEFAQSTLGKPEPNEGTQIVAGPAPTPARAPARKRGAKKPPPRS